MLVFLITSFICIFVDQLTKYKAISFLTSDTNQIFIPGFINLTLVKNTGMAFSLASGHIQITTWISLIVSFVLIYVFINNQPRHRIILYYIAFGFLLGGAYGNIIDRFYRGFVTDFIEFSQFDFPVFNMADIFIDVGIALLLIYNFKYAKLRIK